MSIKTWDELKEIHTDFLANEANFDISISQARLLVGGLWDTGSYISGAYVSFNPDLSMNFELLDSDNPRFCGYILANDRNGLQYDDNAQLTLASYNIEFTSDCNLVSRQHINSGSPIFNDRPQSFDDVDVRIIGEEALNMTSSGGSSSPISALSSYPIWVPDDYMFCRTNVPIFDTVEHARSYISTGSKVGCLNIEGEPTYVAATAGKRYFYDMTLYKTHTGDYADKVLIEKKRFSIYNQDLFRMAGYCNNPAPNNVKFKAGRENNLSIKVEDLINHTTTNLTSIGQLNREGWSFTDANDLIFDGDDYYYTDVYTNITMVGTKGQAQRVIDNIDPEDYSVCTLRNRTGTDIEFQENNDNDLNSGFMTAWITDYQGTLELRDVLHSTNDTTRENIKKFADLWGQNPINTVPGMWYCPIDISDFYESVSTRMAFGNVEVPYDMRYITDQKVVKLADVFINDTFGNFLDYTNISMQLYLPFIGLFDIEPALFFNRTMKIMCAIDFYNATIKYWIYADEKLVTDRTGNIGCQLAVSGTDQVGRARESANAAKAVQSDLIQAAALGAVDPLYAAAKFTQTGVGLALGNSPEALSFKNKGAKMNSGTTSSGVSTYDILYPFLLIDTQNAIIPPALYSTYGMPCNYVGTLGACSGWTECCDVQLKGGMLPAEKDEILRLLAKGVIL